MLSSWVTVDGKTQNYTMPSSIGYYDYKITSPLRMMGALSFILDKKAIISAEYEYVDYSLLKMSSYHSNSEYATDNESIKQVFKPAHNIKAGFEYRLGKISFRTGIAYYDSPYSSSQINKDAWFNALAIKNLTKEYLRREGFPCMIESVRLSDISCKYGEAKGNV